MKIKINKDNLIKILISLDIIVIVVILELMFLEKIPEQEENKVKVAIQSTNEKENNILDNQINNNLIENIVLENTNVEDSNTTNKIEKLENTDEKSEENSTAKKTNNNTKSTNSNTIKKDNESNKTSNNNKNNSTSTSKPSNDKEEDKDEDKEETKPSDDDKNEDNGTFYQSECKTMFNELNKFRKENGKKVLSYSNSLESYAKIRAKEIAKSFSHTRPGGGTILDVSSIYGENIGLASLKNSNLMLDKFINSTEHRKNLLNENFKTVGIACYYSKEKNQFYWVQLFGI